MARRRYLSSAISTDKLVNRLAVEAGDFAALLYTWMIPHAADNATLTGDPEELLMQVFPGRRDKDPDDVAVALVAMVELGLVVWDECCVRFPASFYKYQPYISASRRDVSESAQNSAQSRKSAQNSASFKSSLKLKSSSSTAAYPQARAREEPPPEIHATYEHTINGAMPTVLQKFSAIDKQYTEGWLRGALLAAEVVVGPLSKKQLGKGIDLAVDQITKAVATGKVHSPRKFAEKVLTDYLTEQKGDSHAA